MESGETFYKDIQMDNISPYNIGDKIIFHTKKTFWQKVKEFFFGKKPPQVFTVIQTEGDTSIKIMPKMNTKPEGTTHG